MGGPAVTLPIAILGGGPAGLSCALWLSNYGRRPIIIEAERQIGGLQRKSYLSNRWLLGWQAVRGYDVALAYEKHIGQEQIQVLCNSVISRISFKPNSKGFAITTSSDGTEIALNASKVIIATGTTFAGSNWVNEVSGARALADRIHVGTASFGDPNKWFGASPIVIGGGDSALECAKFLARRGMNPVLLVRAAKFRGSKALQDDVIRLVERGSVDLRMLAKVRSVKDAGGRTLICLENDTSILGDSIFLMFGYAPNARFWNECTDPGLNVELDREGYICVDEDCSTTVPGVYAVGDVSSPRYQCVAVASAMGTVAARHIASSDN